MHLAETMSLLLQHAQAIEQLVTDVSDAQARWRPAPESWSMLEVICHLCDEEREDFRARLRHILDQAPGLPPETDPQGWVTARQYNQRALRGAVEQFMQERKASLDWLRTLRAPDWERAVEGPFGRIAAGDMLAAWAAHDLLHLRQLVELRYAYLRQAAAPYRIDYAGRW